MHTQAKIIGVIDEDPFDYKTWSGSSHFLFSKLNSLGVLQQAISAEASQVARRVAQLRNFHPNINKWKFKYHLDTRLFKNMSNAAICGIEQLDCDYNTILQVGAWYDLTNENKLNISYHDGNLATLLSSPFGHPAINRKHIANALSYERMLYEKMDLILPMSQWLAKSFIHDFNMPVSKVHVVGAGINLERIMKTDGRTYENQTFLMVGKDFERKGGRQLLEAFKIVKRSFKNAKLKLLGPRLENTPDGVECLGFIDKNNKEGLDRLLLEYSQATAFVLPSLYEPFGISFVEAMAHRLPCIGTNICAMPEIIQHCVSGYTVEPQDSKSLANRMMTLLDSPELCEKFGNAGYEAYLTKYNWETVVANITTIVDEKLNS